ncbi:MAG: M48 family metalloprotease, partial [Methylococcales bacterium]|nr:M48 family metalloprotease [Methylococcales bacterium]
VVMIFALWCLSLALKRNLLASKTLQKRRVAQCLMSLLWGVSFDAISDYHISSCTGEQQMAQASLRQIEDEWPMRGSGDAVSRYVQKLGVRLAHFTVYGRNIIWQFSVVRNLAPNAFSIGGGYVFITDGAVNFVQNESELAAILAHEIGHELAGHFCEDSSPKNSSGLLDIFSTPKTKQHQVGVGSMILAIDPIKEQQADQIALSILQAGGYDPRAMLEVSRRMHSGGVAHLMDANRIKSLERTIANLPPISAGSSEDFLKLKRILAAE